MDFVEYAHRQASFPFIDSSGFNVGGESWTGDAGSAQNVGEDPLALGGFKGRLVVPSQGEPLLGPFYGITHLSETQVQAFLLGGGKVFRSGADRGSRTDHLGCRLLLGAGVLLGRHGLG